MHKVELRLTTEGDAPAANFEVYTEALKDGAYVDMAPMQTVAGGGATAPIVLFLEDNERIVVVAKANVGRLVYDREQNANVRVETEDEVKRREEREARVAQANADRAVQDAKARVGEAQDSAANAERDANAAVKRAEADAAKVKADQAKNQAEASAAIPAGSPKPPATDVSVSGTGRVGNHPGNPASANTGPIDSKTVKK